MSLNIHDSCSSLQHFFIQSLVSDWMFNNELSWINISFIPPPPFSVFKLSCTQCGNKNIISILKYSLFWALDRIIKNNFIPRKSTETKKNCSPKNYASISTLDKCMTELIFGQFIHNSELALNILVIRELNILISL